ncbi:MAG: HD domain-containing protein [Planctomycetes bacterium]|nr:HD domain-containing protein [Planctomycetota bacterium]
MSTTQATTAPLPYRFIGELQAGDAISDQVFLVSQRDLRTQKNGGLYIHLVFADRTGQVLARMWQASQEQFETIPDGGFIRVRGRVESYQGKNQIIVDGLRPAVMGQFDISNFLPHTPYKIDELWNRLLGALRSIKNKQILALIKSFVSDSELVEKFKRAPAAVQNHHAYIGGLLEHTCSLLELAIRILGKGDGAESHYPRINRDLVLAGLFFHDIGKTAELTFDTNFIYSTEGQLIGHITQAAMLIDRKIAQLEESSGEKFDADLRAVLIHIVLSHHGSYEFGSPRLPACPEAILVHYIDNIDAKLHMALSAIDDARKTESDWTEWSKPLATRVYKKGTPAPESAE